ncbi:hypothetical protein K2173_018612 [Erythroxylum novogranatense]|uniref:lipid IVA 3-deoxy-D-manno-octulosonic acid transferase n=1 Tax=Erythroxylum novogranatense TaxID=1862640 RepID=A0AAV8UDN0_9ROSI|nr:hypothetical protein K2173_018612 [Erythroxylum novogranatense]
MAASSRGMVVYRVYRALTRALSPLIRIHFKWRFFHGREHPTRWAERLGRPSVRRPSGELVWFHAVSLGEGMAAIPVIKRCVDCRPDLNILMTTATLSAFEVIKNQLPSSVLYQFSPLDVPAVVDAFLDYWKPNAIILMESELWPNLVMSSSQRGISLTLLNARVSTKSFMLWSEPILLPLISLMLSKFSLIVPLSNLQAIRFQLLQAPPFVINFSGDLKYAVGYDSSKVGIHSIEELKVELACRPVWMASSIHRGEEEVVLRVHKVVMQKFPDLITIVVPRYPKHGLEIAQELLKGGQHVALRSQHQRIKPGINVYVVDTLGELKHMYRLTPIAVIGGSFFPHLAGHNISEAAAAGCAVLTGCHIGHFSHMVQEMQRLKPLSVMQVSGEYDLTNALMELLSDVKVLEERQMAAKQAFDALSSGIITNVWNLLNFHVYRTYLLYKKVSI